MENLLSSEIRSFMIVLSSDLVNVDYTQVLQTSIETTRKSVDKTKALLKWDGNIVPSSVDSLAWKEGPYTEAEISAIMNGPDWNEPRLQR